MRLNDRAIHGNLGDIYADFPAQESGDIDVDERPENEKDPDTKVQKNVSSPIKDRLWNLHLPINWTSKMNTNLP